MESWHRDAFASKYTPLILRARVPGSSIRSTASLAARFLRTAIPSRFATNPPIARPQYRPAWQVVHMIALSRFRGSGAWDYGGYTEHVLIYRHDNAGGLE